MIPISENFKKLIKTLIEEEQYQRVDTIFNWLYKEGRDKVNQEFNVDLVDEETQILIWDEIEDEIKRQLLIKFNE